MKSLFRTVRSLAVFPVLDALPTRRIAALLMLLALPLGSAANQDELVFRPASLQFSVQLETDSTVSPQDSLLNKRRMLENFRRDMQAAESDMRPYDQAMVELNLDTGRLYQENGLHEEALDHLARAEHLIRINHGLFAPEQFEPVALSVESHLAMLDYGKAVERQEYLLYLHDKHYGVDAVESVPVMSKLGDLYFDTFQRSLLKLDAESLPMLPYGEESNFRKIEDLSDNDKSFLWLWRAQRRYAESIDALVASKRYSDPLLHDLESRLIRTMFLQAHQRQITDDADNFLNIRSAGRLRSLYADSQYRIEQQTPRYWEGIRSMERLLGYYKASNMTDPARIGETLMNLGDWNLLFGYQIKAEQAYAQARGYLENSDCRQEVLHDLVSPAVPVQLPVFGMLEDQGDARRYDGFIDVAFKINRDGRAMDIEVLGSAGAVDKSVERALQQQIRQAPFRPYIGQEGEILDGKEVSLRYLVARS